MPKETFQKNLDKQD